MPPPNSLVGWRFSCRDGPSRSPQDGGVDPEVYNGFAWGLGGEIGHAPYGMKDIRLFTENDLRFMNSFGLIFCVVLKYWFLNTEEWQVAIAAVAKSSRATDRGFESYYFR